jgi:hypothetical protein
MTMTLKNFVHILILISLSLAIVQNKELVQTPKFGPKQNKTPKEKESGPMKYLKIAQNLYGIYDKLGKFGKKKNSEGIIRSYYVINSTLKTLN